MPDFVPGLNDPSPVSRVIAFGYYDGATDGVLQLGDGGPVYRFDWTDETAPGREREYDLRPLPADAFTRLVAVVGEHIEPRWPAWVPVWTFSSDAVKAGVEREVDAILAQAGEPTWRIVSTDVVGFSCVVAESIRSPTRVR